MREGTVSFCYSKKCACFATTKKGYSSDDVPRGFSEVLLEPPAIFVTFVDTMSRLTSQRLAWCKLPSFGRDNSVVRNLVNKDRARPRAQAMIFLDAAVTTLCEYAVTGNESPLLVAEEDWTASTRQMGGLHPRARCAECSVARHQMFEELIVEFGQR